MKSILIVDDNEISIKSVERVMTREGYNVSTAANGKEAIALLGQLKFDLVVTDLTMPFVSGLDLIAYIKANKLSMPVVVVSSTTDERTKLECYNLGVENFFSKPITPQELALKIRRLL